MLGGLQCVQFLWLQLSKFPKQWRKGWSLSMDTFPRTERPGHMLTQGGSLSQSVQMTSPTPALFPSVLPGHLETTFFL